MKKLIIILAALACGGEGGTGPLGPSTISVASGDAQQAVVGTKLPNDIVFRVRDDRGAPERGVAVSFATASNQGRVSAASAVSNDSGLVSVSWTVGTSTQLANTLTASIAGGGSAVAHATVQPDVPTGLRVARPPSVARVGQVFAQPPQIATIDQFGNDVPGAGLPVTVAFAGSVGDREFIGSTTANTNASGVAEFTGLGLKGSAGTLTLGFVSGTLAGTGVTLTLGAGVPARIDLVGAPIVSGRVEESGPTLRVRALDASGNNVPGAEITFTNTSSGSKRTATTDATGEATLAGWFFAAQPSAYQIVASASATVTNFFTIAARAGDPASLQVVTDTAVSGFAGDIGPPVRIRARDAKGNVAAGALIIFQLAGARVGDVLTDVDGIAELTGWKFPSQPANGYAMQAFFGPLFPARVSVNVAAGPARKIVPINVRDSAEVGTFVDVNVKITDNGGNPVAGATIDWTANLSGGFAPEQTVTDQNGMTYTRYVMATKSGLNFLTANFQTGGSSTLTIKGTPGAPYTITPFAADTSVAIGKRFTFFGSILDRYKNPTTGTLTVLRTSGTNYPFSISSSADPMRLDFQIVGPEGFNEFTLRAGVATATLRIRVF